MLHSYAQHNQQLMKTIFKPGDKVIRSGVTNTPLIHGQIYTVDNYNPLTDSVRVKEDISNWYLANRFSLVTTKPKIIEVW